MLRQSQKTMQARDLMQRDVVTVREDLTVSELADVLQQAHIHGAPVVRDDGSLVGFVSQEDVLFGNMGGPPRRRDAETEADTEVPGDEYVVRVGDIMTAPAVSALEDTDVRDLCRIMWRLRVHHVPIVRDGKVTGIVSSLDLCRVVAEEGLAG